MLLSGGGGNFSSSMYGSNSISGPVPGSPYEVFQNQQLNKIADLSDRAYTPYDVSKMFAGFTPDQWKGISGVRGAAADSYQPYFGMANEALRKNFGAGTDPVAAASGAFSQASGTPTALDTANPYLKFSSQTAPQILDQYMNPYLQGSINEANKLASSNFLENVLPGITKQFVASGGGLGGKNYGRDMNWALTNFNDSRNRATQDALSSGFFNSMGAAQTDLARSGALAGTAGNLALGDLTGRTALGTAQGQNAALGANTNLATANAFQNLGTGYLSNALTANNALLGVGGMQQQQNQLPLTAAYEQFREAQQWPYQTTGWAANTANQFTWPMRQNTQGWQTTQSQSSQSGSPLGSILGTLASVGSLAIPGASGTSAIGNIMGGIGKWFGGGSLPNLPGPGTGVTYARGGHVTRRGGYLNLNEPTEARTIYPVDTFGEPLSRGFFNSRPSCPPKMQPAFADTYARGGHVDEAADREMIRSAVHKHERAMHRGAPLTALKCGGYLRRATGGTVPVIKVMRDNTDRALRATDEREELMKSLMRRGTPLDLSPRAGYFNQ